MLFKKFKANCDCKKVKITSKLITIKGFTEIIFRNRSTDNNFPDFIFKDCFNYVVTSGEPPCLKNMSRCKKIYYNGQKQTDIKSGNLFIGFDVSSCCSAENITVYYVLQDLNEFITNFSDNANLVLIPNENILEVL